MIVSICPISIYGRIKSKNKREHSVSTHNFINTASPLRYTEVDLRRSWMALVREREGESEVSFQNKKYIGALIWYARGALVTA